MLCPATTGCGRVSTGVRAKYVPKFSDRWLPEYGVDHGLVPIGAIVDALGVDLQQDLDGGSAHSATWVGEMPALSCVGNRAMGDQFGRDSC